MLRPPLKAGAGLVPEAPTPVAACRGRALWALIDAAVAWNLVSLRAETLGVSYLVRSAG